MGQLLIIMAAAIIVAYGVKLADNSGSHNRLEFSVCIVSEGCDGFM